MYYILKNLNINHSALKKCALTKEKEIEKMDNHEEYFIEYQAIKYRFLEKYEDIKNTEKEELSNVENAYFEKLLNAHVYKYLMYKKLKEFDSEKLAHKVSYIYFRDHQQIFFDEVYKDFFNLKNEVKAKINKLLEKFILKCRDCEKKLLIKNKNQVIKMIFAYNYNLEDKFAYSHKKMLEFVHLTYEHI